MGQVFISYSKIDQTTAEIVFKALEQANISCWIATRNIAPGNLWAEAIVEAIESCEVFLLILSEHSVESDEVNREIQQAASSKKRIIPFKIDDKLVSKKARYFIDNIQWLNGSPKPSESELNQLIEKIALLSPLDDNRLPSTLTNVETKRKFLSGKYRKWSIGLLVLVMAVSSIWVWNKRNSIVSSNPTSITETQFTMSPSPSPVLKNPTTPVEILSAYYRLLIEKKYSEAYDAYILAESEPKDLFVKTETNRDFAGTQLIDILVNDNDVTTIDEDRVKVSFKVKLKKNGREEVNPNAFLLVKKEGIWKIDLRGIIGRSQSPGVAVSNEIMEISDIALVQHVVNGTVFLFNWKNKMQESALRFGFVGKAVVSLKTDKGIYTYVLPDNWINPGKTLNNFEVSFREAERALISLTFEGLYISDTDGLVAPGGKTLPPVIINFKQGS